MAPTLSPGLTVLGNLAIDRIDHSTPTPGGCPAFIGQAIARDKVRVVTSHSPEHADFFAQLLDTYPTPIDTIATTDTARFSIQTSPTSREIHLEAVGHRWSPSDIEAASIDTTWVHLAPLTRSDFPLSTLLALKRAGHKVSYDAQGLVRAPSVGVLSPDAKFDALLLGCIDILKVSDDEEIIFEHQSFLSNPNIVHEILYTKGPDGAHIIEHGESTHIRPSRVLRCQNTGAGEVFAVAYALSRATGHDSLSSAHRANQAALEMLSTRLCQN